jgi:hypothetical protein
LHGWLRDDRYSICHGLRWRALLGLLQVNDNADDENGCEDTKNCDALHK